MLAWAFQNFAVRPSSLIKISSFFVRIFYHPSTKLLSILLHNHHVSKSFWRIFLGIRKIHGPTDTRTLYTDLFNDIIFWKLEKYTDPISFIYLFVPEFWQFVRWHKSAQTHPTNLESINIRYMEDPPYWIFREVNFAVFRSSKMAILDTGKSDFPIPKSHKAF